MSALLRALHDLANTLESSDDAVERIRHALGLLRQMVAYDQCGLLEVRPGAEDRVTALPELPQPEDAALSNTLRLLFTRVSEGTLLRRGGAVGALPGSMPWSSRLAVPLVGLDEVIGLLFVAQIAEGTYTEKDLSVVSLVGAQLAAYLTALREQTDRIAANHTIDELRELQEFTETALAHAGVNDLLNDVLECVRDRLEADAVTALLLSDDGLYMVERASVGLPRELGTLRVPMPAELARVVTRGEPVSFADLASLDVACAPICDSLRSLLGAPLLSDGRLIGILLAGTRQPGRFTEHHAWLLRLLGDRVALPLERARLYEEEQTARVRAEAVQRRLALLSEVTTVLTASLDYEGALQSVARLMVPGLADVCVVDIAENDGELRQVALANMESTREDEIRQSRAQHAVTLNSAHPVAHALRSGRPQVYHPVPDLLLTWVGGKCLTTHRTLHIESALVVPLVARGRPLGTMTCATVAPERYQPGDVALAEQVGHRVALAVDNGRLYREAHSAAARYRRLLSQQFRTLPRRTRSTAGRLEEQPDAETTLVPTGVPPSAELVEPWLDSLPLAPLTPRERDLLQLLVAGASTPEIARRLVVSEYTVRFHLRNLFLKLEVHSRTQLVAQALHLGLARSPDCL